MTWPDHGSSLWVYQQSYRHGNLEGDTFNKGRVAVEDRS